MVEVSQPDKILDLGASDSIISVSIKEVEQNVYMVAASTEGYTNLYLTKASGIHSSQKK